MARRRVSVRRHPDRSSELARKSRWTAEEARVVLEAQSRSGQSLAAFARSRGIGLPRLYKWSRKVGRRGVTGGVTARFLPVRVVSAGDGGAEPAQGSGLEIVLGSGRRIRLAGTFDSAALAQVLEVLEPPAC